MSHFVKVVYLLYWRRVKTRLENNYKGIDYFAADAGEAFDSLRSMIQENFSVIGDKEQLIENVRRARFYLTFDYMVHTKRSSTIVDHCCQFALTDSKKHDFTHRCDHAHSESRVECVNLTGNLDKIEKLIETTETDQDLLDRSLRQFYGCHESLLAWAG